MLYTGIAINPTERLQQHRSKKSPGAKFTRRFNELSLVYQVQVGSRSQAQRIEYHLRKKSRQDKLAIISHQFNLKQLLKTLALEE